MHFSVISRALKNAAFTKQTSLKCAQDVVDALNQSYIYRNEEIMRDVKVKNKKRLEKNPLLNHLTSFAVLFNPPPTEKVKVGFREITKLTAYYNFKNIREKDENDEKETYEFYSTIFSDLIRLVPVHSVIDVNEIDISVDLDSENNRIISQTYQEYNDKVERNINAKRVFIDYVMKAQDILEREESTSENSRLNVQENQPIDNQGNQVQTTSNPNRPRIQVDDPLNALIPKYCIHNCSTCNVEPFYKIEDIKTPLLIRHDLIKEELLRHSHKKNLQIKKKSRTVAQAKAELIEHYRYAHNYV
jgi:hypothetical protein